MTEYIEREAALLSLTPIVKRASERNRNIYSAVKQCVEAINWCSAADVQPVRHGRWKPYDLTCGRSIYYCTACNHSAVVPTVLDEPIFNYCPNCGAKMDGGNTDER